MIATSACDGEATTTLVVAELLPQVGSLTDEHGTLILAVVEIAVPGVPPRLALTTSGKLTGVLMASELMVQVIVPPEVPTVGRVPQLQPVGTVNETKVVPVGIASVNVAVPEVAGPLLTTVWV